MEKIRATEGAAEVLSEGPVPQLKKVEIASRSAGAKAQSQSESGNENGNGNGNGSKILNGTTLQSQTKPRGSEAQSVKDIDGFKRFISTWRATMILLGIYAVAMAIATFAESSIGTAAIKSIIYNSWWFGLLHILLITNFIAISIRTRLIPRRRWGALALHYGFAVIVAGAMITHFISFEGFMHIREGATSSTIIIDNNRPKEMPFKVTLKDFKLVRYPGSNTPSSYESEVIITHNGATTEQKIFMNNIARVGGFRLYQTSYDADEKGTILTVSRDEWGTAVTYIGYGLLFLGLVWSIFQKGSRFRTLYASLGRGAATAAFVILSSSAFGVTGTAVSMIATTSVAISSEIANQAILSSVQAAQVTQSAEIEGKEAKNANAGGTKPTGSAETHSAEASRADTATMQASTSTLKATEVAAPHTSKAIKAADAKKFGELMILSPDGRVGVVNTYSSEILRKIFHRSSFRGMNGDQVLISMLANPQEWSHIPIIYVSVKEVAQELGTEGKHISYIDLFDSQGNYKLNKKVETIYQKPPQERSKSDKEWIKVDEKVNIMYSLFNGGMMPIFPTPSGRWVSPADSIGEMNSMDSMVVKGALKVYLTSISSGESDRANEVLRGIKIYQHKKISEAAQRSNSVQGSSPDAAHHGATNSELSHQNSTPVEINPTKLRAELLYNRADIFRNSFRLYLILGFTLMVLVISQMNSQNSTIKRRKLNPIAIITAIIICVFVYQTVGIGLRWFISGRAPWTNAYESMVYVGWTTVLSGLIFAKRSRLVLSLATLLGGVILFVSNLNWLDPQITQLAPVLKSYWLMLHVSVITASYGFFGMCAMCGISSLIGIIIGHKLPELRKINELAMTIGLILLTIGIFFGAIWANESWGRYWGWDPKETWALITMVAYAMITHSHFMPKLNNDFAFATMSVTAIYTVLMTFFGVNYYLSGLHSYGNNGGGVSFIVVGIATTAIALLILIAWFKAKGKINS